MKQLNHCTTQFVLLTFLLCSSFVFGQKTRRIETKEPGSPNDNQPRTLKQITTVKPGAEIKFVEMHFRKPPLVEIIFDVELRNDRAQPRWFLLPSHMYPNKPGIQDKGGVDALEVFAPRSKGRVIIGRFLGTGGFQALLLPAHAEIHLRALAVEYWGEVPESLQMEVIVAKRLVIGGDSARSWFRVNPMSNIKADSDEAISGQTRTLSSHRTPDNKEVTAQIDEDRRFKVQVSLKDKRP